MTDNVVQFGDFVFRAKAKRWAFEQDHCPHKHLELDDNGDIVLCLDCKKQVSAYWALRHITTQWHNHAERLRSQADHLNERVAKNVSLLAAQEVERAWRSRTMVPTCPHCRAAILPDDGFGGSNINKAIELRRRAAQGKLSSEVKDGR